uniref:hypothetical protein n=1 Tax=Salmonella enterica TaxID=28901 RepID=UPI00345559BF
MAVEDKFRLNLLAASVVVGLGLSVTSVAQADIMDPIAVFFRGGDTEQALVIDIPSSDEAGTKAEPADAKAEAAAKDEAGTKAEPADAQAEAAAKDEAGTK